MFEPVVHEYSVPFDGEANEALGVARSALLGLGFEIVEDTETAFEVRVTECLWAKTFRDADAADLGYACICHPDYAMAKAFNPKLHMVRDKPLMQGCSHCNHRWEVQA